MEQPLNGLIMLKKLIKKIEMIMKSGQKTQNRRTQKTLSFETLLYGLSILYTIGINIRIHLYRTGIFKSGKLPCFVISIGNICVGGTGKTPMTIYISRFLTTLGYKVAIVTRGYKGTLEHKGGIVSDGKTIFCGPKEAGDEPFMLAQVLKLPVIAGKKRVDSGMTAIKKFSPDIILLDDAFQHLALARNLDIVLMDAKKPLGNGYLLPRGVLREPVRSIHRCDAVVFTRADRINERNKNNAPFPHPDITGMPNFKCIHTPYIRKIFTHTKDQADDNSLSSESEKYKGKRILLFSGIADNQAVKTSCEKLSFLVEHHIEFADHHWYTQNDIDLIISTFKQSRAEYIATTQKDVTRLSHFLPLNFPLIVFDVQIEFNRADKIDFERFLKKEIDHYLKRHQPHRTELNPTKLNRTELNTTKPNQTQSNPTRPNQTKSSLSGPVAQKPRD